MRRKCDIVSGSEACGQDIRSDGFAVEFRHTDSEAQEHAFDLVCDGHADTSHPEMSLRESQALRRVAIEALKCRKTIHQCANDEDLVPAQADLECAF